MAMTKEDAYQEYEVALGRITEEHQKKRAEAKAVLNAELNAITDSLHAELKGVRNIQQRKGK